MSGEVVLSIDNKRHEGWTSIHIMRALNGFCAAFELGLAAHVDDGPDGWAIDEQAACVLSIDGEILITGYVDTAPSFVGPDSVSFGASGRDRTGDLVDCSAEPKTYRNQTLQAIAADLIKPFGLELDVQAATGAAFPHFVIEQGETVFDSLVRLTKQRGLLLGTTIDGRPQIFSPKPSTAGYGFEEGKNSVEIGVERNATDRFSDYIMVGQQKGKNVTAQDARAVKAIAKDPGMRRYRPLRSVSNEPVSQAGLKARADWEATAHKASGLSVTVSVPGWRAETGKLYTPGVLVPVTSPTNRLKGDDYVIAEVQFLLDEGSYRTDMVLAPPEAFTPEPLGAS